MVDMSTYRELHEDEEPIPERDYLRGELMQAEEPPDEKFLLLLPATIHGFGFKHKDWSEITLFSLIIETPF